MISRRVLLAGLLSGAAQAGFANAPLTSIRPLPRGTVPVPDVPEISALVRKAALGGNVGFAVRDLDTDQILEQRSPFEALPPASSAKAITALYALDALGSTYRFVTRLLSTGPVENGQIQGDLILVGGGDPLLDTDDLAAMIARLKEIGVTGITGRFRIWAGALPNLPFIDPRQPDHVGYNPAISGLNLNFNRVHFEWKPASGGFSTTMQARGEKFSPDVDVARMKIVDQAPVYSYMHSDGVDQWRVARRALGNGGSRWLPVRRPGAYAEDVFLTLARSYGFDFRAGEPLDNPPTGEELLRHDSPPLRDILRGMLRYSTNITAEVVGLSASIANGNEVSSLQDSANAMNLWLESQFEALQPKLSDHSGLGYGSLISPGDMLRALSGPGVFETLEPILKTFPVQTDSGETLPVSVLEVRAKTGTLNFVSALAGYVKSGSGRTLSFAIFTADQERRDSIPIAQRERPEGARSWASRSRRLQKDLILRWAGLYGA